MTLGMAEGVDGSGLFTTHLRGGDISDAFSKPMTPMAAHGQYYYKTGAVDGVRVEDIPGQHTGHIMVASSDGQRVWKRTDGEYRPLPTIKSRL